MTSGRVTSMTAIGQASSRSDVPISTRPGHVVGADVVRDLVLFAHPRQPMGQPRPRAAPSRGARVARMLLIGSIVLRVDDLGRQAAFWAAALDYVPRAERGDDFLLLRPRNGIGPKTRNARSHLERHRPNATTRYRRWARRPVADSAPLPPRWAHRSLRMHPDRSAVMPGTRSPARMRAA